MLTAPQDIVLGNDPISHTVPVSRQIQQNWLSYVVI